MKNNLWKASNVCTSKAGMPLSLVYASKAQKNQNPPLHLLSEFLHAPSCYSLPGTFLDIFTIVCQQTKHWPLRPLSPAYPDCAVHKEKAHYILLSIYLAIYFFELSHAQEGRTTHMHASIIPISQLLSLCKDALPFDKSIPGPL